MEQKEGPGSSQGGSSSNLESHSHWVGPEDMVRGLWLPSTALCAVSARDPAQHPRACPSPSTSDTSPAWYTKTNVMGHRMIRGPCGLKEMLGRQRNHAASPSMEGWRRKVDCSSLGGEAILLWGRDGQTNLFRSFQPRILLTKRYIDLNNLLMLQTRSLPSLFMLLVGQVHLPSVAPMTPQGADGTERLPKA